MTRYAMAIDLNRCTGCYNCQVACKDEHVGNNFPPIAKSQPTFGHFWVGLTEVERVLSPSRIKVVYIPRLCQHCGEADCIKAAQNGAVYRRDDGIVIIDPEKAVGQKQLVESCRYGAIFWNEEQDIPQKCTFCAHLLDDGWQTPRCVQTCPTGAMKFGDLDDPNSEVSKFLAENTGEELRPELGSKPNVLYFGLPKSVLTGTALLGDKDEYAREAKVTLVGPGNDRRETLTDCFGDFEFKGLVPGRHTIRFDLRGYETKQIEVDVSDDVTYIGEIVLSRSQR